MLSAAESTDSSTRLSSAVPRASVTVKPGSSGENGYTLSLTDHTRPWESFSTAATCATATCVDSSGEWVIERPAFDLPFGFQILPLADFDRTFFQAGDIVSGTVRSLMPYGAFLDLGGLDGLLHVSDIAWTRIQHPADVLSAL